MKEFNYQINGAKITVIDKSSHEERKQRLEKPLQKFFTTVEREKRTWNKTQWLFQ